MVAEQGAVVRREDEERVLEAPGVLQGLADLARDEVGRHRRLAACAQVRRAGPEPVGAPHVGWLVGHVRLVECGPAPRPHVAAGPVVVEPPHRAIGRMAVEQRHDHEERLIGGRVADVVGCGPGRHERRVVGAPAAMLDHATPRPPAIVVERALVLPDDVEVVPTQRLGSHRLRDRHVAGEPVEVLADIRGVIADVMEQPTQRGRRVVSVHVVAGDAGLVAVAAGQEVAARRATHRGRPDRLAEPDAVAHEPSQRRGALGVAPEPRRERRGVVGVDDDDARPDRRRDRLGRTGRLSRPRSAARLRQPREGLGRATPLVHQEAAGDVDRRAGDVAGVVGRKEHDRARQLLRLGHVARAGSAWSSLS